MNRAQLQRTASPRHGRESYLATRIASLALVLPIAALLGTVFRNPLLLTFGSKTVGMSTLTALSLFFVGLGVIFGNRSQALVSKGLSSLSFIAGVTVLFSYGMYGEDLASQKLNELLFPQQSTAFIFTSMATAVGLTAVSLAVVFHRSAMVASNLSAFVAVIVGTFALLGKAYGFNDLSALPAFEGISIQSAISLAVLGVAAIFMRQNLGWAEVIASNSEAGRATRRQLVIALLPMVSGWFLLQIYDPTRLGQGTAMAFLVIITVVPLLLLVLRDGNHLLRVAKQQSETSRVQNVLAQEMEEEIASQTAEIERQHHERAVALEAAFGAQRLETVGQLTGGIAHDFNNLLMSISGNVQMLRRKMDSEDPHKRYADNAAVAIERAARLTSQLLTFSRSQKLNIRPVELGAVLRSARDLIGSSLGPNISIDVQQLQSEVWVNTDSDQLELAILNMAVNSRDAMPDGGLINVAARQNEDEKFWSVLICDNGTGMHPEVLARAAEPFYTTKERGKGTGLGLAQVHGFTLQSGGEMKIRSRLGEGTTIEIVLPLSAPPLQSSDAAPDIARFNLRAAKDLKIMVVDDDPSVRQVLEEALAEIGCTVSSFDSAEAALPALNFVRPDAAVVDFIMPKMNGAEFALLAQKRWPNLPIIFVSGYAETIAMDGVAGATVLRKPFDVSGLQNAIASVVPLENSAE